jgi:hypothetical protein
MAPHLRHAFLPVLLILVIAGHSAHAAQWTPTAGLPANSLGQPGGAAQLDGSGTASSLTVVPSGGTASRTLAARAGDIVNLREFGAALGDGSDATAAIAAAMASSASPTIHLSAGTYRLRAGTYTAGSSVSLVGDGAGKSIIQLPPGCSQTGDLLVWAARSHVTIQDVTLDLDGCTANGLAGAFSLAGGSDIRLQRVAIVNAGTGNWLEASINGSLLGWIQDSYFQFTAPQTIQNQAINVSSSYAQADGWHIKNNTLVNSGALVNAAHLEFVGNNVSGWGYGAGISTSPTLSPDALIAGNMIHDSATGKDQDGAWPTGIEGWGPRQVVTGNKVVNVAASCVFIGGPSQSVTGNWCQGAGKRADGAGSPAFQIGYVSASQSGNGSTLLGNTVVNDGTGTTIYGLADSAATAGVYAPLAANTFVGATAAASITGGTSTGGSPGCGVQGLSAPTPASGACQYGSNNQITGLYAAAGGQWLVAQGVGSIVHGLFATDRYRSADVFASGQNAANGDSQAARHVLRATTTGTAATRLTTDGSGIAGASNCLNLPVLNFPANQQAIYGLTIRVIATDLTSPGNFLQFFEPAGTLTRTTTASTTVYIPSGAATTKVAGTAGSIAIAADTSNACLAINWTAPNADTWHVVARVDDVEAF